MNPSTSRFWYLAKKSLLPSLLVFELLLIISLRWKGWDATLFSVRWLGALLAATLPLVIAIVVLFRSGFRFRLKSLLVAFALLAIFLGVSATPVLHYSQQRRASVRLRDQAVEIFTDSQIIDFDTQGLKPSTSLNPPNLSAWLTPLVGNLPNVPRDTDIKCVMVSDDNQIKELCISLAQLSNLQHVALSGTNITDVGFELLVSEAHELTALTIAGTSISPGGLLQLSRVHNLRYLSFQNTELPDTCLRSLPATIRSLFLWAYGPNAPRFQLTPTHMKDIGAMRPLETLMILGYNITDQDTDELSELPTLRHLVLKNTLVTRRGEERLKSWLSSCRVACGTYTPSPDEIDRQFSVSPDAGVLWALNLIERRFMTLLQYASDESQQSPAIWKHPEMPPLLHDLVVEGFLTEENISDLHAMHQFQIRVAGNAQLVVDDRSPDFEKWAAVAKQVIAGLDRAIEEGRVSATDDENMEASLIPLELP